MYEHIITIPKNRGFRVTATLPKKSPKRNRRKNRQRDRKKTRERNCRLLNERKRRILGRIVNRPGPERDQPMMTATNIHYELADRVQGLSAGGIGAMLTLARRTGLIRDIDSKVHVLKRHLPYHESDHVLNIAFNIMAGGKRIEHIELRRTTRSISMPWAPSVSPTRPPPGISAAASMGPRSWT